MRPKSVALLLMALGCGLVASIGITEVMSRRSVPDGAVGDMRSIFVAIRDVPMGEPLDPQDMKLEQWPKDKVPLGALSRIDDVEGRRVRTKLYAGEPILENRLLGKGASEQGATALIPKGYRVVPVKVDLVSGGSSMILPGDRVDVMVHSVKDAAHEIPETITQTVLQDIKVFAVDDIVDLEKDKDSGHKSIAAKTISLLVTPEQAALVMLASHLGTINLVMRSPEDDELTPNAQARPSQLFSGGPKSDRSKETLASPAESTLGEKTQGFIDFLNGAKNKGAEQSQAAPDGASPRETWTMRMLKPGEVNEVQFEPSNTAIAAADEWKPAGTTGRHAAAPRQDELKRTTPSANNSAGPQAPSAKQDGKRPNQSKDEKGLGAGGGATGQRPVAP